MEGLSHAQFMETVQTYGLWAVFFIVMLESIGMPLPGELIVVIGATIASSRNGPILPLIATAALGAIVGDNIGYTIGRKLGKPLLLRHGWRLGLSASDIKVGQYLFKKYGAAVVFLGRFTPLLRILAAFLAGANSLAWRKFFLANAAGAILWAGTVASAAYWFGQKLRETHGPMTVAVVVAGVALLVAGFVYLHRNGERLAREAEAAFPGPIPGHLSGPATLV